MADRREARPVGAKVAKAASAAAVGIVGAALQGATMTEQYVKIAGASWEFADGLDCWNRNLPTFPVQVWGTDGSEADRTMCANECLKRDDCVAFNFPGPQFPNPKFPYDPQVCYLKRTAMNSEKTGITCEKAFNTEVWHYYSLLDSGVWARMIAGLKEVRFPFFRALQVSSGVSVEWIDYDRWQSTVGHDCHGETLKSSPVDSAGDTQAQLKACARQCIEEKECMAFNFPVFTTEKAWDASSGEAACVLKAFKKTKTLTDMLKCDSGSWQQGWKFYALVDAWKVTVDPSLDWVRIPSSHNKLSDAIGSPCEPNLGRYWKKACQSNATSQQQDIMSEEMGTCAPEVDCCVFMVNRCRINAKETCKPYNQMVSPKGCSGLCKTKYSACSCWTQNSTGISDGSCCTSCEFDCDGQPSCLPANCAGPEQMCDSEAASSIGGGSVCACSAQGLSSKLVIVLADVAAGWTVDDKIWS